MRFPKLHIVIPVYNEDNNVLYILRQIRKCASYYYIDYHIYFIDDHSDSQATYVNLSYAEKSLDVSVALSTGRGQQEAVLCGFREVLRVCGNGDYVCTLDCDMQDPVGVLMRMYRTLLENSNIYDAAIGVRCSRKESIFRIFAANLYCLVQSFILKKQIPNASNFYVLKTKDIGVMDKDNLSMSLIMNLNVMKYGYNRRERSYGVSKYTVFDLCRVAFAGIKWCLMYKKEKGDKGYGEGVRNNRYKKEL